MRPDRSGSRRKPDILDLLELSFPTSYYTSGSDDFDIFRVETLDPLVVGVSRLWSFFAFECVWHLKNDDLLEIPTSFVRRTSNPC